MTKEQEAKRRMCLRLYKLGFNAPDIAEEVGMSVNGVAYILKNSGGYKPLNMDHVRHKYYKKRSIVYWADYYAIPVKSCYGQLSKSNVGTYQNDGVGSPRLITESEFLSKAIYTRAGRKLMEKMFIKGLLLTRNQIKDSI